LASRVLWHQRHALTQLLQIGLAGCRTAEPGRRSQGADVVRLFMQVFDDHPEEAAGVDRHVVSVLIGALTL
jgi:hypothetical protein